MSFAVALLAPATMIYMQTTAEELGRVEALAEIESARSYLQRLPPDPIKRCSPLATPIALTSAPGHANAYQGGFSTSDWKIIYTTATGRRSLKYTGNNAATLNIFNAKGKRSIYAPHRTALKTARSRYLQRKSGPICP